MDLTSLFSENMFFVEKLKFLHVQIRTGAQPEIPDETENMTNCIPI